MHFSHSIGMGILPKLPKWQKAIQSFVAEATGGEELDENDMARFRRTRNEKKTGYPCWIQGWREVHEKSLKI
ncbi:hypothetical protein RHMOL_Rhmol09G0190200 [Rhododendron molle]|uniref:Uncharacterized protein n=1 Tax=Rhododendron molle TaxID=49168 RepID=A0ACC0MER7_RHOML|nr:hypothetical protein RHMOL_Rhmol09G0190200 [Rhododendron molle]